MTSEKFAKKVMTENTFWPTEWAADLLDGTMQLARDYLLIIADRDDLYEILRETRKAIEAPEGTSIPRRAEEIMFELYKLRAEVKRLSPVEWEEALVPLNCCGTPDGKGSMFYRWPKTKR